MLKITINYDNLLDNIEAIKNYIKNSDSNAKIIPMIKSDAYRLNEENVVNILIKYANIDTFFTFSLLDAIRIRNVTNMNFQNKKITIYSIMGMLNKEENDYYNYQIIPTINNLEQYNQWNNFAKQKNEKLNCILQFNTGMNRSGFEYYNAKEIKELFNNSNNYLNIDYIVSHLCCAGDIKNPMNKRQINNMLEVKKYFNKSKFCFSASEGIFLGKDYYFDAIRPFRTFICPVNYKDNALNIKQVLEVTTNIINIKDNIATINIGYQNEYKKELLENKNLSVLINNKKYKVLDIQKTQTKIQIDNKVKINDNVIITNKDLCLTEITENSSIFFIEPQLLMTINKFNQKNVFYKFKNLDLKNNTILEKQLIKIDNKRFHQKKKNLFETFITETRLIKNDNEYVGYSSKYKAEIGDKICLIPIGYFDIDMQLIRQNKLKYTSSNGTKFIIVGNPSMNQITIKCNHKDNNKVNVGDKIIIEIID